MDVLMRIRREVGSRRHCRLAQIIRQRLLRRSTFPRWRRWRFSHLGLRKGREGRSRRPLTAFARRAGNRLIRGLSIAISSLDSLGREETMPPTCG